jgi:hypothetical protein
MPFVVLKISPDAPEFINQHEIYWKWGLLKTNPKACCFFETFLCRYAKSCFSPHNKPIEYSTNNLDVFFLKHALLFIKYFFRKKDPIANGNSQSKRNL